MRKKEQRELGDVAYADGGRGEERSGRASLATAPSRWLGAARKGASGQGKDAPELRHKSGAQRGGGDSSREAGRYRRRRPSNRPLARWSMPALRAVLGRLTLSGVAWPPNAIAGKTSETRRAHQCEMEEPGLLALRNKLLGCGRICWLTTLRSWWACYWRPVSSGSSSDLQKLREHGARKRNHRRYQSRTSADSRGWEG